MALETLFIAGSIASLAGGLVGAVGQAQSLETQKAVAERNAVVARQTAEAEADRQRRNDLRAMASAQTAMASSGLLVTSGSSLAVLSDMAAQQAENQLQIRYGGQVKSADARNRATAYGQKATGALIGGASNFAGGAARSAYVYDSTWGGGNGRLFG